MKKFWNWIKDSDETRTLRLEGPIDEESFWGDEITPQMFRDELNAGEGDVTVWINSPGGNVFAAAEIYTMLKDYKGSITVKIDAIAASAASVVAMAGDTVQMSPVAMLMIHDPSTVAMGNTKDMEKAIEVLNEVKESIINAYASKSGLSHGEGAVFINKVVINNMDFEEAYNTAIQQKSIAQQNADKQKIENEAAIAKAEADKQVAITNAEAEAQKTSIAADAQAEANRRIAESLSDTLIEYQKIQKWDGKLPTVSGSNALVSIDPAE